MRTTIPFCVACRALERPCRRCEQSALAASTYTRAAKPHPAYWLGLYHAGDDTPTLWHRLSPTCSELLAASLDLDDGPHSYEFVPPQVKLVVARRSSRPVAMVELATTPHAGV